MSLDFLLHITDEGVIEVSRPATLVTPNLDPTFATVSIRPEGDLTMHLEVGQQKVLREVRIIVNDDAVPVFGSIEEADAWLDRRGELIR